MKQILTLFFTMIVSNQLFAQAPFKFTFQGIFRNNNNEIISNSAVKTRFSVIKSDLKEETVYSEIHNGDTNVFGMCSFIIGDGSFKTGELNTIKWIDGNYILKTEIDADNKSEFRISGISRFLSVPYSLYSADGIWKISNSGDTLYLGNKDWYIIPGISLANPSDPVKDSIATDIDGNIYKTKKIGNQVWMTENLKVTRFNNGLNIPNIRDSILWSQIGSEAWCYFENDSTNNNSYGKIYNGYAISNILNICPTGWHIPMDSEWKILFDFLGGFETAGGHMKSTGTLEEKNGFWFSPNIDASNKAGFSANPGGYRSLSGQFLYKGTSSYWWSGSRFGSDSRIIWINFNKGNINANVRSHNNGHTIRCIKD